MVGSIIHKGERVALFIDGANLYYTTKSLGYDIDYRKLLAYFGNQGRLVRAFYYTALFDDHEYSPIRPLMDWLDYNGYTMITKPAKEHIDIDGKRKIKGNMDIELAIDLLEMSSHIDHAVIFSGDGDFKSLLLAVQRKGLMVTVVSTLKTQPPMIADELRRQADQYIDLVDIEKDISKHPADTTQPLIDFSSSHSSSSYRNNQNNYYGSNGNGNGNSPKNGYHAPKVLPTVGPIQSKGGESD